MPEYKYKAKKISGKITKGNLKADTKKEAVDVIRQVYPIILEIQEVKVKDKAGSILNMEIGSGKVNGKALAVMCSQFAIIIKSGVPLARCVQIIAEQTADKSLKKMLMDSYEDVLSGKSLATSFEINKKGLPVIFTETIRAGELSGNLSYSFSTLANYFDGVYNTSQQVKGALVYPIFVLIVAMISVIVVMVKVIPTLSASFIELGGDMPVITKVLINMSNFMQRYWIFILWVVVAIVFIFKVVTSREETKISMGRKQLKFPILGKLISLNSASLFANTIHILLVSGLSLYNAMMITSKVFSNAAVAKETVDIAESMAKGKSFSECMHSSELFPEVLVEMSSIGEETGELEKSLETIGKYYENEAAIATAKVIGMIQPIMMVILAIIAGFIVISIYLPMFTLYDLM